MEVTVIFIKVTEFLTIVDDIGISPRRITMKIFIEKENKQLELEAKDGNDLLSKLEINPDSVLLVVNDNVVLIDTELKEDDNVKILSVVSGG